MDYLQPEHKNLIATVTNMYPESQESQHFLQDILKGTSQIMQTQEDNK